jgi:hypothetical protein
MALKKHHQHLSTLAVPFGLGGLSDLKNRSESGAFAVSFL